jgi:putative DNA primase/helicase
MTDAQSHRVAIAERFAARISAGDALFFKTPAHIHALPFTQSESLNKPFSGTNLLILLQVMADRNWQDPRFFTIDQIQRNGWDVRPQAQGIQLQYFQATGNDGLPLESPVPRVFRVFNAADIFGIGNLELSKNATLEDVYQAALDSGMGLFLSPDHTSYAIIINQWLEHLSGVNQEKLPQTLFPSAIAGVLLKAQTGLDITLEDYSMYGQQWAEEIKSNPAYFYHSVKEAELLSAEIISHVRAAVFKRETEMAIQHESDIHQQAAAIDNNAVSDEQQSKGNVMARKSWNQRVAGMYEERESVLAVPFVDKGRADALGAIWYQELKVWFVPKGLDVTPFKEWLPAQHALTPDLSREKAISSFKEAMEDYGLDTSETIKDDGKWHNVSVNTKKSKSNKSGSYIFSLNGSRDGGPIGTIINKYTGEQYTWKHDGVEFTPEQRARFRAEALVREENAAKETLLLQNQAAVHAKEIWSLGTDPADHGYVAKKGIVAIGLKQISGSVLLRYAEFFGETGASIIRERDSYLLIPMMTENGDIRAVQAINEDGSVKTFMRGAQKKGTMYVLGAEDFKSISASNLPGVAYAEGYATAESFYAGNNIPVVVTFDAGNLETVVAQTVDKLSKQTHVVLAVDNDQFYVERAAAFLADKIGLNPHFSEGQKFSVVSGPDQTRSVSLGEAVVDGDWHKTPKGTYRVVVSYEDSKSDVVNSVHVEVVPTGGRTLRSTFLNRGLEAGHVALQSIANAGRTGHMLVPSFNSLEGRPTDWNDLQKREGIARLMEACKEVGQIMKNDHTPAFNKPKALAR